MLEIFEYDFMRDAFIIGTFIAIILPCVGITIVLKRLSMIGETLSHASLAGLSIGLVAGISPILSAIIACIFAGLSVELIRNKLKAYQEISTVIILAASIGLAGIVTSFVGSNNSISSYLFGSIVTISKEEFYSVIGISLVILIIFSKIYNKLFISVFDPKSAKILGINIKFLNFTMTFLSAVAVSISAKTIGSLIVSSLLVIPVMCAMQITKTYRATLLASILLSIVFVYAGLVISYFYNLRPGSVIVLLSVVVLIIMLIFKKK